MKAVDRQENVAAVSKPRKTIKRQLRQRSWMLLSIASQVCNYRHPKLATVKVGGDRENPLLDILGRAADA